jgi:aminopeptidase N
VSKRLLLAAVLVLALVAGTAWWLGRGPDAASRPGTATPSGTALPDPGVDAGDEALAVAESEPREDSYYPRVGDPGVDALHYDLDLTWDPDTDTLTGITTLAFRSTTDADSFRLDLGAPLEVSAVELDGEAVTFDHLGKDLVVGAKVAEDGRYTVQVAYTGTPEPVPAPTTRSDFSTSGWTITKRHEVWTMQEPFGAYTWYAVNDQPSDKALYDFTIRVPAPWTGVANGTMTSDEQVGDDTVTTFHLAEPASSYLVTIAIGDYRHKTQTTSSGTPVNLWALRRHYAAFSSLRYARPAIEWIEKKLGPYPFSSAGIVLTDSSSGMETQTLLTLGNTTYIRSAPVIIHEMVHQWYGDLVTPTDWRDVWMNEGMTMYLQLVYEAEMAGDDLDASLKGYRAYDQALRSQAGPPGAYNPAMFGESNIYYCPALMWHALRQRLGDRVFWRLVREWPQQHAFGNATREQWFDWIEQETGEELTPFFDAWLMGSTTPPAG